MEELRIDTLLAGSLRGRPSHVDEDRVALYASTFDQLPPVVAFRTPDGLLLVDGYHRAAAALRLGHRTIAAKVREGTCHDALRYAVAVGAAQTGQSEEEVMNRILGRAGE